MRAAPAMRATWIENKPRAPTPKTDDIFPGHEPAVLNDGAVRIRRRVQDRCVLEGNSVRNSKECVGDTCQEAAVDPHEPREPAVHPVPQAAVLGAEQVVGRGAGVAPAADVPRVVRNDPVARLPVLHVVSHAGDDAGELVAEHHGRTADFFVRPVEKADVGAADACGAHLDEHVGGPHVGDRDVPQLYLALRARPNFTSAFMSVVPASRPMRACGGSACRWTPR